MNEQDLIKELSRYKSAYNILIEYFDSIPDEEKVKIDKKLKKLNL